MHSWTHVRRNSVFGASAQVFLVIYLTVETRHVVDTYASWFEYISDTYQCTPALCLEGTPLCGGTPIPVSVHLGS